MTEDVHNAFSELMTDRFLQLVTLELNNQGTNGTGSVSFQSGLFQKHEGYKYSVFAQAQTILQTETWTEDKIGSESILGKVMDALVLKVNGRQHNLLNWRNMTGYKKCLSADVPSTERLLYRLYCCDEDEQVFNDAAALWGKKYPLLSFLFFLKDRERYLPVRPSKFRSRMERLGLSTACLSSCTWDNYTQFISEIRMVQRWLLQNKSEDFDGTVSLLDAHSFVWMQWMLDTEVPISSRSYDYIWQNPLESVVSKEGGRKEYYVTRYERSARNRREAVRLHGLKCMACGFDFEEMYGELGRDFIEVHHVKPLSSYNERVEVNPQTDLICLCSNCHSMIHRRRGSVLSLEELQALLNSTR